MGLAIGQRGRTRTKERSLPGTRIRRIQADFVWRIYQACARATYVKRHIFVGFADPHMEQLTDPGELYARAYHACAVSNDMFVSWGGSDSNLHAVSGNVTLFYNLKKNVWQTSYSPVPEEGDSETPFGRLSSLSLAVIIGVTAGSIGIVLVAGYVFYRRRQRQRQPLTSSAGILGEGSSSGISTTKHPFWPLEALQNGESEPGIPMVAVGLLHEQRQPQQLLQSHGIKRTRHPSINSLMKRQSLTLGRI